MTSQLLAACWTSAGDTGPSIGDEVSPVRLRERVEIAAAEGWNGMGFSPIDLAEGRDSLGWGAFRSLLDDNGIEHVEAEQIDGWWSSASDNPSAQATRAFLLEAAEHLGMKNIKISADLSGAPQPFDAYVEGLATLAREAGEAGTRVAMEPMPMAHFRTVMDGMRLVDAVDSPFAGLCVDIWHVARADTSMTEMAEALDVGRVFTVELDDADAECVGSLWDDTIHRRRYCGEGDLDVSGFIAALRNIGFDSYWGVEMLSEEHRKQPVADGLRRARETTLALLDA